jgi:hypothetical protein
MNFKLLNKNNLGCVALLLLVVLLCQSRLLDLLFDTVLGRTILVLFIILIAHANRILGVVAVLFVIIAFNNSYTSMVEGFADASANKVDVSGNTATGAKGNTATVSKGNTTVTNSSGQTAAVGSGEIASAIKSKLSQAVSGKEGFDLVGRERYIQRGKQSNSIPVHGYTRESNNVSAFDGSFTDSYTKF